MSKASDNPFPSALFVEGSAPASPASGDQRIFIDVADHKLKRKDNGGTVTTIEGGGGGGMTDPETTAGDMIIHDASNVLARLPIGSVGQLLGPSGGTPIPTYLGDTAYTAPTFSNSWVSYGAPFAATGYMKDAQGFVHLRGAVKSGSSLTAAMFTLPSGYRPSGQVAVLIQGSAGVVELDVTTAGVVAVIGIVSGSSTTGYVGLDSVTFSTL